MWNELKQAGTTWNELEQARTSWNELEPTTASWNEMELAKASTRKSYGSKLLVVVSCAHPSDRQFDAKLK